MEDLHKHNEKDNPEPITPAEETEPVENEMSESDESVSADDVSQDADVSSEKNDEENPQEDALAETDKSETGPSPLNVKLSQFEGPLDLLLHLIKENKLDIFDIPINFITEQYLSYLSEMKKLDLDVSGEFLVMAATLMYIKSRMLLPVQEDDEEDEDEGLDPRDELVEKLLEYQSYKQAAKTLGEKEEERSKMYTRSASDSVLDNIVVEKVETEFTNNLYDLIEAFSRVVRSKSKEIVHEIYEESVSIEEMIHELRDVLTIKKVVSFKEIFSEKKSINELIATFMAMLELGKLRFARIEQGDMFGDIVIKKAETNESEPKTEAEGRTESEA